MNSFATLNLLASALQLTVPSYGLRLVRRFGAQRVGGFLIFAFAALAMLNLLNLLRTGTASSTWTLDAIGSATCALLLIGMGHLDTLCAERQRAEQQEQSLRNRWETKAKQDAEQLLQSNEELARALAQAHQKLESLSETEKQYRFLFTEHPQPMWISDLRTGQFLAVNQAALKHYGFTHAEFMRLNVKDLVMPEAAGACLQDMARPCHAAERRGCWSHRKKDQTIVEMELTAFDLRFCGTPARLVLAEDVGERRGREERVCQQQKAKVLEQIAGGFANHFNNIFTAIEGHTGLLLNKPQPPATTEQLQQLSQAAQRGATLTRQLLLLVDPAPIKNGTTEFISRSSTNGADKKPLQPYTPDQLVQTVQACVSQRNDG
jgi:PAS domain S-box-containing protein